LRCWRSASRRRAVVSISPSLVVVSLGGMLLLILSVELCRLRGPGFFECSHGYDVQSAPLPLPSFPRSSSPPSWLTHPIPVVLFCATNLPDPTSRNSSHTESLHLHPPLLSIHYPPVLPLRDPSHQGPSRRHLYSSTRRETATGCGGGGEGDAEEGLEEGYEELGRVDGDVG
jgi:hypothetical protein